MENKIFDSSSCRVVAFWKFDTFAFGVALFVSILVELVCVVVCCCLLSCHGNEEEKEHGCGWKGWVVPSEELVLYSESDGEDASSFVEEEVEDFYRPEERFYNSEFENEESYSNKTVDSCCRKIRKRKRRLVELEEEEEEKL